MPKGVYIRKKTLLAYQYEEKRKQQRTVNLLKLFNALDRTENNLTNNLALIRSCGK